MSSFGYSGLGYDRHVEHQDNTTIGKMKERYWIAKQVFRKRLGKKEDDCVILCDAELDAKLETFQAIATSCIDLLQIIEEFQENVGDLVEEENAFGKFIQDQAKLDQTRAGKIMAIFGKSQLLSSYHRIQLQTPLQRMYQDIYTFHQRAVKDTFETIEKMEKARLQYRAALLWMKDISQNLDPDTFRQLDKFRKVQAQVKKTRTRFERIKFDSIQKIDLLAASRCNMFSNSLVGYQNLLIQYWGNTARVLHKVSVSFNGYQFYEFNKLKQLTEISRKLAQEFSPDHEPNGDVCNYDLAEDDIVRTYNEGEENERDEGIRGRHLRHGDIDDSEIDDNSLLDVMLDDASAEIGCEATMMDLSDSDLLKGDSSHSLNGMDFGYKFVDSISTPGFYDSKDYRFQHVLAPTKPGNVRDKSSLSFENISKNENMNADLKMTLTQTPVDPSPTLFESMNMGDDFSGADLDSLKTFMPSHLLDSSPQVSNQSLQPVLPAQANDFKKGNEATTKRNLPSKEPSSSWLDKFADLDPLANPDLIGYVGKESDNLGRNC